MFIFILICLLLIPSVMTGIGLFWKKNTPGKINMLYGYRTIWSMKSQETWDFAHKYAAKVFLYTGIILGVISVLILIVFRSSDDNTLGVMVIITTVAQLAVVCLSIIPTERALKVRFDKNGKIK